MAATGHVTVLARPPKGADFPGVERELMVPGSPVFHLTDGPVDHK